MIDLRRRDLVEFLAVAAIAPAALFAGVSMPAAAPLLPPLAPLSEAAIARCQDFIRRYARHAADPHLPLNLRSVCQHMVGLRECMLAFPHADAIARLQALSGRYPLLKPNVDGVIAARIEARGDWEWDYAKIRPDRIADRAPSTG